MTQQEQQALERFLNQRVHASVVAKNPQADSLIRAALAKQPDTAYLQAQRAMLREQALEQAQARIGQLRAQGGDGFLPRNNPWSAAGVSQPIAAPAAPAGQASGFLGNVATTAAGVVAGRSFSRA